MRVWSGGALAALLALFPAEPTVAQSDPCLLAASGVSELSQASVAHIDADLDIALEDGRKLTLAGIATPPDLQSDAKAYLDARLAGETILWRPLLGGEDRWGRVAALVFAMPANSGEAASLQTELLEAGLTLVRAPGRTPCRAPFLAAEAEARNQGVGLWLDPAHALMNADSAVEEFRAREGQIIVLEGRVANVAAYGYRTYVNFGPRRYRDVSVTVLQPDAKMFDKKGNTLALLAGHTIRVRGVLDMRFGPQLEISDPEAIEVLDTGGPWPSAAR